MEHVTQGLPCSICGLDTFRHDGWYLVKENHWLDRLRILSWHPTLATQRDIKSACCRQHLKTLIAQWLNQPSLRSVAPGDEAALPNAREAARTDIDLDAHFAGRLVGELSVHREMLSCGWTGSPATLESILDAIIPVCNQNTASAIVFPLFHPSQDSPQGLHSH